LTRCHACGATNADSADWCGQCYASLVTADEPAAPPESATAPTADAPTVSTTAAEEAAGSSPDMAEGFRRSGDTVEWQCPTCEDWNSVDALRCGACATPLSARWERRDADAATPLSVRFDEPWTAALALSAVIPGAGHIGLRRYGSGIARAVLFAVWLTGGVALLVSGGVFAGAPLLLGTALLWAGSLADVAALRAGRREILGGRALLWLVVGVLGLTVLALFAAALRAPGVGRAGVG